MSNVTPLSAVQPEWRGACKDCKHSVCTATKEQLEFAVISPNLYKCKHPEVIKLSPGYHVLGDSFPGANCMFERISGPASACQSWGKFFEPKIPEDAALLEQDNS